MPGTPGRSGRKANSDLVHGDGLPEPPRSLSERAKVHFEYLIERLPESVWSRVDGVLLASVAELLESQEIIANELRNDPADLRLIRARMQLHEKLKGISAVLGMSPRDRALLSIEPQVEENDPMRELLLRQGCDIGPA